MKTRTLSRTSVAIITGGLFAAAALAGPSPHAWRNQSKASDTATAASAAPMTHANAACNDARLVSVTETAFLQANGRGPIRTVEVGKKLICTSCDNPMIVMKPSGHNARGAMAPVAIKGSHDCTKNGCTPAATLVRVD